jgi:membrane AbrB-like protein
MILFCGALAAMLVHLLGIDPLTAYLATSPGGVDSVAIIAASTKVDTSFVMSLQTSRFLVILLVGPAISRFVAGLVVGKGIATSA